MHGRRYPVGPYVIALAVAAVIYAAIYLGQLMWPADGGTLSWNPLAAAIQLVTGESAWPPGATVLLLVAAALLVVVLVVLWNRGGKTTAGKGPRRMTEFERRVNANQNTGRIQERQRRKEMEHLHPDAEISEAGVQIGRALDRGRDPHRRTRFRRAPCAARKTRRPGDAA